MLLFKNICYSLIVLICRNFDKIICKYNSERLYRKDDNLPFTCFGDAPSATHENVSLARCSLACNNLKNCLVFQYYETNKCDLFVTWSIWIKQSVGGCSLYTRAGLCPPSFVYFPLSNSCYKLEVGSWNWEQARSWCNHLSPPYTFPAIINTTKKNDAVTFYLNSIKDSNNIDCYNSDYFSRKMWIGGQRIDPANVLTIFVWKPFPNVALSLGNETFWFPTQPDAFLGSLFLESCMTFWHDNFNWNDLSCYYAKCVLCEATPILN
ncbi:hypothetical protein HELRODRAFT_183406 [Helobdella robusta]|uniref:C-type lectin domain-containing protein n=1 Tax=Helobdella robusta TaxID=6412 RepID=T1FJK9_HELRO|nr:hypothetical protein HELRODRAFT_183406 [Helobdella robusta]ESO11231.1 hypothetical protein HELRODRAFT_183406 [Helobdella robusta]